MLSFMYFIWFRLKEHGMMPFQKDLTDKHVFLTGAGGGLGRLLAIKLAKKGCKLSLVDVNLNSLEETLRQIK